MGVIINPLIHDLLRCSQRHDRVTRTNDRFGEFMYLSVNYNGCGALWALIGIFHTLSIAGWFNEVNFFTWKNKIFIESPSLNVSSGLK